MTSTLAPLREPAAAGATQGSVWRLGGAGTRAHLEVALLGGHALHGEFGDVAGRLMLGEDGVPESVEVRIGARSLTTDARRDRHLRSAAFLDVDRHPHICFRSRRLEPTPRVSGWRVHGDLRIRDVARPVVLDVAYDCEGCRATVRVRGQVDRRHFGLVLNRVMERTFGVGAALTLQAEVPAVGCGDLPVTSPCTAPAPAAAVLGA